MTPLVTLLALGLLGVQERRVALLPEGVEPLTISFSNGGRTAVYSVQEGNVFRLVVGDTKSKASGLPILPILSRIGPEVYFAINIERGIYRIFERDRVLFDLELVPDISFWIPGAPSGNGKVLATTMRNSRTGTSTVLLNGKAQKAYTGEIYPPVLNHDGSVVAFVLENDDGYSVVVNDVPGPTFDYVSHLAISADGKTVAYGAELEEKAFLVRGNERTPIPQPALGVFMSPDGATVGYWRAVKRPDGRKCAQVVVGNHVGPEVERVHPPLFSPDGKSWTYRGDTLEKSRCVVVDDRLLEVPTLEGQPTFVEEGREVGYGVRKGRELWWQTVEVK